MILLFDDGGDKIANSDEKEHSVGKFGVNKIWATDITDMAGTKHNEYDTIDEALKDLVKKGPGYSPVLSDEGIEVAEYSGKDKINGGLEIVIVQNFKAETTPSDSIIKKIGVGRSVRLEEFKKYWNDYINSGVLTYPTDGFVK
jgi:hypothetical protein